MERNSTSPHPSHLALLEGAAAGRIALGSTDAMGNTPLHLAAFLGEVGYVRRLLGRGADDAAVTVHNLTPLHLAFFQGHADAALMLLAHWVDNHPADLQRLLNTENDGYGSLLRHFGRDQPSRALSRLITDGQIAAGAVAVFRILEPVLAQIEDRGGLPADGEPRHSLALAWGGTGQLALVAAGQLHRQFAGVLGFLLARSGLTDVRVGRPVGARSPVHFGGFTPAAAAEFESQAVIGCCDELVRARTSLYRACEEARAVEGGLTSTLIFPDPSTRGLVAASQNRHVVTAARAASGVRREVLGFAVDLGDRGPERPLGIFGPEPKLKAVLDQARRSGFGRWLFGRG